jgi:hypothetical protein
LVKSLKVWQDWALAREYDVDIEKYANKKQVSLRTGSQDELRACTDDIQFF